MPDSKPPLTAPRVALIGFGEAGSAFAAPGGWDGHCRGWDIVPARCALMAQSGVTPCGDAAEALDRSEPGQLESG